MKGLILCGGKGSRLRPHSYSRPKQLLPVVNKPVIQYAVDKMRQAGINEIGIVIPPSFISNFDSVLGHEYGDVHYHYIEQLEAKGLADAVRLAKDFIGDHPFLVFLGDNFYTGDLSGFVQRFQREQPEALLMVGHVSNPSQFGVVQFEGTRVIRLVEKPKNPPSSYAIVGIYLFRPGIFKVIETLIPSARGEYELTDAIQGLIDRGCTVLTTPIDSWWKDTGQSEDLLACNRHVFLELRGEHYEDDIIVESSTVEGPVIIQEKAQVIDSIIRGPVAIGPGAQIIRSYIGPFTSIGANVLMEDSEIENSIVLERSQITKIQKRIDESIIGGEVKLEGVRGYPRTLRVNIGDHSVVYLPFEEA